MIWLGIAAGVFALGVVVAVIARRPTGDGADPAAVDPLFTVGVALTGAGVALATTVGAVMYAVMTVGLIVMAVGAQKTRHHGRG